MKHKVAAVQMVSTANIEDNLISAQEMVGKAVAAGAELVLLPEVFAVLEGGPMRQYGETLGQGRLQEFLAGLARQHGILLVGGTIPIISRPGKSEEADDYVIEDQRVRASCLVYDQTGALVARYDKIHLFDVQVDDQQASYSESRSYEAGTELVTVTTPLGELGLSVCYDLRFPELYRALFRRGAQLITVPSAFTRITGQAHWESLLRARAIENQCYIIAAGQGGRHNEKRETWGHSMIIDPWGTVLSQVTESGPGLALADIDMNYLSDVRKRMPIREQIRL